MHIEIEWSIGSSLIKHSLQPGHFKLELFIGYVGGNEVL